MNWLITGGCGFIGRALLLELLADGNNRIRILDNYSVGTRADIDRMLVLLYGDSSQALNAALNRIEFIDADVRDKDVALSACGGMDIIVHLAANTGVGPSVDNPRLDCETNVLGVLNYLEGARRNRVKRFVFASSGAPIGACVPPIHEEMAPHPVSPYGASKLAGEAYCSAYFRSFGVETVALRFSNVYGPGSTHKSSVVAKFIRSAIAGDALEVFGDGKQTRDFLYIDDLVQAIVRAAAVAAIGGEVFQIATSAETTVDEVALLVGRAIGQCGFTPPPVRYSSPRTGDVLRNFSDTSKAKKILGWQAVTGLEEGVRRTCEWFARSQPGRMPAGHAPR